MIGHVTLLEIVGDKLSKMSVCIVLIGLSDECPFGMV